ncbi:MAG: hypothetical protein E7424_08510 [Ruminococcaceae bacterium]|nr:hypothetical protein [Oscillospiraceae bacterium]
MSLLNMSVTGGVFILAVLLLRAAFQNIVSRRTFLILWLAANALLLIPFRFRLPISIYTLVNQPDTAVAVQAVAARTATASQPAAMPWWRIVWIAGGALLLAVVLIAHGRNLWRFRKAEPVAAQPSEIPSWVRVKTLPGLPSPLAYGFFHPTILIPAEDFATPEQLRHVYLHELCHIRHFDVPRRYLMLFALAVHWFNPLVWIMYYVATQDMEMRCDEQAIRQLGAKKAYATTLVAMETGKLQHLLDAGFSFSSTGSRLKAILRARRLPVISAALALVLCIVSLTVFATDAAKQAPAEPEKPAAVQEAPEAPPAPEPEPEPEPEPVPESTEAPETEPEADAPDAGPAALSAPATPEQQPSPTPSGKADAPAGQVHVDVTLPDGRSASVPVPSVPESLKYPEESEPEYDPPNDAPGDSPADYFEQLMQKEYEKNREIIQQKQAAEAAAAAQASEPVGPRSAMPDPYATLPTARPAGIPGTPDPYPQTPQPAGFSGISLYP